MKILGIDYGRAKIGLAVGETQTRLVEPLAVWPSSKFKVQSAKLAKELGVEKIVVGVPGGKMEEEIRRFGERLRKQTGLAVEFFDETLTSQEAQKLLLKLKRKRKFRHEKEDAFAAAIMLEFYLDRLH
ncbi:MAG TPA: Holliday junction resolvase RuvX [Patescibacteria group bacterium]|nr:Holliday junction resolvase RuvX [Patescibacteria group bacterium]